MTFPNVPLGDFVYYRKIGSIISHHALNTLSRRQDWSTLERAMRRNILVVDDAPQNIHVLRETLKQDYRITAALSGEKALQIVENGGKPDVILLDIVMSGMSGYDVCRKLKENRESRDIPIIFISAKSEIVDKIKGFEVGGVDYVTKPFEPTEVLARVKTQIDLAESREIIEEKNHEQRELLHILCHDVANPLTTILWTLNALKKNPDRFEAVEPVIRSAVQNGIEVVDLVRKMRATEEKVIELAKINLRDSIEISVQMLDGRFREKNVELEISVDGSIEVLAERTSLINSVLNNALTNALKFSHPGAKVQIYNSINNEWIVLAIRDNGIGIPTKLISDLFDIGKSTSRTGTSGETGTGFGMSLMRKFVDAYKGKLAIDSTTIDQDTQHHGTTIYISFRQAEVDDINTKTGENDREQTYSYGR